MSKLVSATRRATAVKKFRVSVRTGRYIVAGRVMAGMVPDELAEAAHRVYAEQTRGQEMPAASPSAVVRYALATLAGVDPATVVPLRMGRPRNRTTR